MMPAVQPSELFLLAETRALSLPPPRPPLDAAIERLRSECVVFFDQVPEPPLYRRADDPLRKVAQALIPGGQELLARCLAISKEAEAAAAVKTLVPAMKAHLETLCHIGEGSVEGAEEASRRAAELSRSATSARRLWARTDEAPPPVFDAATGASRYDPSPDPMVKVRLACPTEACRQVADYAFSPRHATHRFTCTTCKAPFLAHFGEVRAVEVTDRSNGHKSYVFRIEELAGGLSRVEFDDASGGELSVARRDLVAFLYTDAKELKGVLDLSSSRLLWIQRGGPCFVATVAFGEHAVELAAFRAYRDRVLRRSVAGNGLVRGYYWAGPALASGLARWPAALALVRCALERVHRRLTRNGY
jgi:hypothetical protein